MRLVLPLALAMVLPIAAHAQAGDVEPVDTHDTDEVIIDGAGLSRDIPCEGQNIGIYGAGNRVHLTGACGKIFVHGDSHVVIVDKAMAIDVSGADHVVDAGAVSKLGVDTAGHTINATLVSDSASAQVAVNGAEQTLNLVLASPTAIEINGTEQIVNWSLASDAPEPRIDMSGVDNAVNRVD